MLASGLLVLIVGSVMAQTNEELLPPSSISATQAGIIAESIPPDDAVLIDIPTHLDLHFGRQVRLVKLVLYDDQKDWVDISFRYNPRPADQFSWQIPMLAPADYYTADWAILGENEQLIRGSFSFTFGNDAEPPSVIKERQRLLIESRSILPGLRELQNLGTDPAEIIINDAPAPRFEPPFAPILN